MTARSPTEIAALSHALQIKHNWGPWNADGGIQSDFCCEYCDKNLLASVDDYEGWQMDHIEPQSKKGLHGFENIAIACRTCNFIKGSIQPDGSNRAERVASARKYIQERRLEMLNELNAIRVLVGLPPLQPPND